MSRQLLKREEQAADKEPLTMSSFVLEFEYGVSSAGYWTHHSMILQLEDCADVVATFYPEYQSLFCLTTPAAMTKLATMLSRMVLTT
jgi:hypothetical protein